MTEVLDATVRDIAAGHIGEAAASQREARRMLVEFEKARAGANTARARRGAAKTA